MGTERHTTTAGRRQRRRRKVRSVMAVATIALFIAAAALSAAAALGDLATETFIAGFGLGLCVYAMVGGLLYVFAYRTPEP